MIVRDEINREFISLIPFLCRIRSSDFSISFKVVIIVSLDNKINWIRNILIFPRGKFVRENFYGKYNYNYVYSKNKFHLFAYIRTQSFAPHRAGSLSAISRIPRTMIDHANRQFDQREPFLVCFWPMGRLETRVHLSPIVLFDLGHFSAE